MEINSEDIEFEGTTIDEFIGPQLGGQCGEFVSEPSVGGKGERVCTILARISSGLVLRGPVGGAVGALPACPNRRTAAIQPLGAGPTPNDSRICPVLASRHPTTRLVSFPLKV